VATSNWDEFAGKIAKRLNKRGCEREANKNAGDTLTYTGGGGVGVFMQLGRKRKKEDAY